MLRLAYLPLFLIALLTISCLAAETVQGADKDKHKKSSSQKESSNNKFLVPPPPAYVPLEQDEALAAEYYNSVAKKPAEKNSKNYPYKKYIYTAAGYEINHPNSPGTGVANWSRK